MATDPLLSSSLGFNIMRLSNLFRRRLIHVLRPWELTPERWQVLAAVMTSDEELSQSAIANLTMKDRHAVSRMLDGMEEDGWILRSPSSSDSRAFWIRASSRAEREFPIIRKTLVQGFSTTFARMSAQERETLLRLARQLTQIFESEPEV